MPPRSERTALMRLPIVVLLTTLGVLSAQIAAAQSRRRIAVVHPDEQLMRSLRIALSAWDIDVVSVDAPSPGMSLPQAARNAAQIAQQAHVDAVAWVSDSNPGSVLWIYDAETDHVGLRVLGDSRPFDEPTAAAAALSVKALLRSSSVAPVHERTGATVESRPRPGAVIEAPSPPAPPPERAAAPVVYERVDSSPYAAPRPSLWIEGEAAGRVSPSVVAEPRGTFGAALWPRGLGERLGCAIDVSGGVGVPIATSAPVQMNARFHDWVASSSVRTRLRVGQRFALEPALGGSAHFTSLEGTGRQDAEPLAAHQIDGSLDAAVSLDFEIGSVGIGARASMEYLVRYPRYLVDGEEVLTLMPFVVNVGVRLRAGIF